MKVYLCAPPALSLKPGGFIDWLFGKLVCFQTRSEYCHVAISNGYFVWESTGRGVSKVTEFEFFAKSKDRFVDTYELVDQDHSEVTATEWLDRQVGKPYDFTMVIRFLTRKEETRESAGKWFCSELVFAALRKATGKKLLVCEPWRVSPGHLAWIQELAFVSRTRPHVGQINQPWPRIGDGQA